MLRRSLLSRIWTLLGLAVPAHSLAVQGLSRVNTVLIGSDRTQTVPCQPDVCTQRDGCDGDTEGHVCQTRDICDVDDSADCSDDECVSDRSGECITDNCTADSSGECTRDACLSDASGGCTDDGGPGDECEDDYLGGPCKSDASGGCTSDSCSADSSKECAQDQCIADSSGYCEVDSCTSDSSGECWGDACVSDKSGGGHDDRCVADSSGDCAEHDDCVSDSSGGCLLFDACTSDSSGDCGTHDSCVSDSSKSCQLDSCASDASGGCEVDSCVSDGSGACLSDLCRSDKSGDCGTDSCAIDTLADSIPTGQVACNAALRWLYRLSIFVLATGVWARAQGTERVVIDLGLASLAPPPATVVADPPVAFQAQGSFLADFDGDGVLEADTNGNGLDAGDPEVRDWNHDGTRELPPGTSFQGRLDYTDVWVPSDVLIESSGTLQIYSETDIRVFGAVRLAGSTLLVARGVIDLRASAWLMEDSSATLEIHSGLNGSVDASPLDLIDELGNLGDVSDSDQDGQSDSAEGTGDQDEDGLPDWMDQDTLGLTSPSGLRFQVDLEEGSDQRLDWTGSDILKDDDPSLPAGGRPRVPFSFGLVELKGVGDTQEEEYELLFSFPFPIPDGATFWAIDKTDAWVQLTTEWQGNRGLVRLQDGGSLDRDGVADARFTFLGGLGLESLFFSHFGDGLGQLYSQILLMNLDSQATAAVDLHLHDNDGEPLTADLDGEEVQGQHSLAIPAGGLRSLSTDGVGALRVGSVSAYGDRSLSGVILFGGTVGVAGVGAVHVAPAGFLAPVESSSVDGIKTGIAVMNMSGETRELELTLSDADGNELAAAQAVVAPHGHLAAFAEEFTWQPEIDLSSFLGVLRVDADGALAATVLQTRPGELATLPVVPPAGEGDGGSSLYFAHFGNGLDSLFSQIVLFNLHQTEAAPVTLLLRDDHGNLPDLTLNGEAISSQYRLTIPPRGLRVLRTSGQGELLSGSVRVSSTRPVAGVILFSGVVGAAGVGSSPRITGGFSAPMEIDSSRGINTGIALMNLGLSTLRVDLALHSEDGRRLARATDSVSVNGHLARFVDQFEWDQQVDFASFRGLLRVTSVDPMAATVLQTRPGQFATMPVVVLP